MGVVAAGPGEKGAVALVRSASKGSETEKIVVSPNEGHNDNGSDVYAV